ncbi:MAG: hypothetical protein GYB42_07560 [Alphaproteobacteria bacterium]|nr:hypothetical protein [Alphaproteobacteria bacterium]
MSLFERPAYWIGTLSCVAVFLVTLQLVLENYLPDVAVTVSVIGGLIGMIATLCYVLATDGDCEFGAEQTHQSEKAV